MKSKKKHVFRNFFVHTFLILILCLISIYFVIQVKGVTFLRRYLETGIGTCAEIPILCKNPTERIINPELNSSFKKELIPHEFNRMRVSIPKGFGLIQETIKKAYYKRRQSEGANQVIYVLYQEKDFFIKLYPQIAQRGIKNDYQFMKRVVFGRIDTVSNLVDAFFVIMKSIFTPNIGDQKTVRMAQFSMKGFQGFISYNIGQNGNYYDCNIFNNLGGYFKVYIRDKKQLLGLPEVFTIISTLKEVD